MMAAFGLNFGVGGGGPSIRVPCQADMRIIRIKVGIEIIRIKQNMVGHHAPL